MSNITPRTPQPLVEPSDPQAIQNPTKVVPYEARGPIGRLWACNTHLLPGGGLPLYSTFRVYLDDHGLDLEDVPLICSRLLSPDRRAGHRYASDLFADLAALVAETVRKRRTERETAQRLAKSQEETRKAAPPSQFIAQLREIGRMDSEHADS